MAKKNFHITLRPDGRWQYIKEGATRASGITSTQALAETKAKGILSKQGGGEVVIHGRDGRIRDKDTVKPGNDPRHSIDTKF